jgi:hypothetical protein
LSRPSHFYVCSVGESLCSRTIEVQGPHPRAFVLGWSEFMT